MHLAAEIATQRDAARVREVNVEGMRRLLDAAARPARRKVVFTSTVVTGEANGALLTEDAGCRCRRRTGIPSRRASACCSAAGLPVVVVRPGHIYGPGGWFEHEILARLRRPGRFAVIGRGDNLWDVVHVDDVAGALVDALERAPAGEVYHAADDEPITYYDFMALSAQALGVGRRGGSRPGSPAWPPARTP